MVFVDQVPQNNTLITPAQCRLIWRQFERETEYIIIQAITSQVCILELIVVLVRHLGVVTMQFI